MAVVSKLENKGGNLTLKIIKCLKRAQLGTWVSEHSYKGTCLLLCLLSNAWNTRCVWSQEEKNDKKISTEVLYGWCNRSQEQNGESCCSVINWELPCFSVELRVWPRVAAPYKYTCLIGASTKFLNCLLFSPENPEAFLFPSSLRHSASVKDFFENFPDLLASIPLPSAESSGAAPSCDCLSPPPAPSVHVICHLAAKP